MLHKPFVHNLLTKVLLVLRGGKWRLPAVKQLAGKLGEWIQTQVPQLLRPSCFHLTQSSPPKYAIIHFPLGSHCQRPGGSTVKQPQNRPHLRPLTCEGVPDVHSPITAHHILRGFKLARVEDTLAVLGVNEAGGCLTGPIPIVVQWPEAHSTVLAATQKEVLTAQGSHTFDSPCVA